MTTIIITLLQGSSLEECYRKITDRVSNGDGVCASLEFGETPSNRHILVQALRLCHYLKSLVLSFEILVRRIDSCSPQHGRRVNKQERGHEYEV